jgi:hypothetical protein
LNLDAPNCEFARQPSLHKRYFLDIFLSRQSKDIVPHKRDSSTEMAGLCGMETTSDSRGWSNKPRRQCQKKSRQLIVNLLHRSYAS